MISEDFTLTPDEIKLISYAPVAGKTVRYFLAKPTGTFLIIGVAGAMSGGRDPQTFLDVMNAPLPVPEGATAKMLVDVIAADIRAIACDRTLVPLLLEARKSKTTPTDAGLELMAKILPPAWDMQISLDFKGGVTAFINDAFCCTVEMEPGETLMARVANTVMRHSSNEAAK